MLKIDCKRFLRKQNNFLISLVFVLRITPFCWSSEVKILTLFSSQNWIAGLNIPLRVTGMDLPASTPVKPEVVAGSLGPQDCKVMRDPAIPENFLLKCLREGSVSIKLTLNPATTINPYAKSTVLNVGPLTIKKMEGLKVSGYGVGFPGGSTDVLYGQQLYASFCSSCHQSKSQFLVSHPANADRITAAVNGGVSMMASLKSMIDKSQIEVIAIYLNAP